MFRLLLAIGLFVQVGMLSGQGIVDPCFFSVGPGLNFQGSADISNIGGTALLTHHEGVWYDQGDMAGSFGISIASPVVCAFSKVFFFPMHNSEAPKGVAFRLNAPLQAGQNYSYSFTYVSHGTGSNPSFAPKIYTGATNAFSAGGQVLASFWGTLPNAGANWSTQDYTFNAGNTQAGHQWLFVIADQGSGMLFNNCHIETDPILPFTLPQNLVVCEGESINLSIPVPGAQYEWSTGEPLQTISVSNAGIYTAQASNLCNKETASTTVTLSPIPELNVSGEDTVLCAGESFLLEVNGIDPQLTWGDGSTASSYLVTQPGLFEVRAVNDCFDVNDEVLITYDTIPRFSLPEDTTLCVGQELFVDGTSDREDAEYLWNDGVTDPFRTIVSEGNYVLNVSNDCGSSTEDITVLYSINPGYIFPDEMEYCAFRSLLLDVSYIEGSYTWNNGSSSSSYLVTQPGIYTLTIVDDDGCFSLSDQVRVNEVYCECPVFVPNAFSPNEDGINDVFISYHECEPYDYELIVYNRWGQEIHRTNNAYLGWDGVDPLGGDQSGIYTYLIRYRESHDGITLSKTGSLNLLR